MWLKGREGRKILKSKLWLMCTAFIWQRNNVKEFCKCIFWKIFWWLYFWYKKWSFNICYHVVDLWVNIWYCYCSMELVIQEIIFFTQGIICESCIQSSSQIGAIFKLICANVIWIFVYYVPTQEKSLANAIKFWKPSPLTHIPFFLLSNFSDRVIIPSRDL